MPPAGSAGVRPRWPRALMAPRAIMEQPLAVGQPQFRDEKNRGNEAPPRAIFGSHFHPAGETVLRQRSSCREQPRNVAVNGTAGQCKGRADNSAYPWGFPQSLTGSRHVPLVLSP